MVRKHTARRLLILSVLLALATGLLVAAALAPSDTRAAAPVVKDGGTLVIGTREFDVIDPALARPPDTFFPFATAMWPVEDATCALLLRYPIGPPPIVHYRLMPEVATAYPEVSADGKTYTFTIRK